MADRPLTTSDLAGETHTGMSEAQTNAAQSTSDRGRFSDPAEDRDAPDKRTPTDEQPRDDGQVEAVAAAGDPEPRSADQSQLESSPAASSLAERGPLLPADQSERFSTRWQEIQTSFVDQPRDAVEQADAMVADLMQRLAASFSNERERLEAQWDRGDDVSTEDLRVALTRYRSFFDRLLSA
jgi:hypothetical protein